MINAIYENFFVPPGSYFFLLLGVVIVAFIVYFLFSKLWSGIFWYYRFRERNRDMASLAQEFDLSFQSGLSSFWAFVWRSIAHDIEIDNLQGSINNHNVEIQDMLYSLTTFVTWIAPRSLEAGNRKTLILLDGQELRGNMKDFSLGNPLMLTTVDELRNFLKTLR